MVSGHWISFFTTSFNTECIFFLKFPIERSLPTFFLKRAFCHNYYVSRSVFITNILTNVEVQQSLKKHEPVPSFAKNL